MKLRRLLLLLLTSFVSFLSISQDLYDSNKDYLVWKQGYLLSWDSYKAEPDSTLTSEYPALTYVSFLPVGKAEDAKVVCVFDSKSSWTTSESQSLLEHEQLHFDLGEVYARRIRRDLQLLLSEGQLNEKSQFDTIEKNYALYSAEFQEYVDATEHGMNKAQQRLWFSNIATALRQLAEYQID